MNRTSAAGRVGQYLALLAYLVFLGFPLLWLLSVSLKSPTELASVSPSLIPHDFHWINYSAAFGLPGLLRSALNSTLVALGSMVLTVVVALPAAYALGRFRTRLRGVATGWILVSQLFPVILTVIPLFVLLRSLGLLNTLPGLVLVYLVWTLPFALWMLRGYVTALPVDLEEAAAVDGASRIRILVSIVLPLLRPGLVAVAMFSFISAWNEFFFALVLIQDSDLRTLPLTLARFVGAEGQVSLGPLAAGSVLATIPSLLVFAIMQRRLTSGLLAGAVKG
ncbi:carbohydrate ABC transporter permease [Amycolatopsis nigrescens]|uniref:carbohydrate ABC transporter permease n=1 Tax=Amycolatopsis nigrescens TaxID=381445 RepID=UPI000477B017|nr:carbohydrate ABC transporter permease [Amycolatopsis nigrescens]